ncbi:MAG TPA: hypothetical protein VIG08_10785 [Gemmatimonadales bacterium]
MSRSPARLYPFLLAIIPAVHMVAANPGQSSITDLVVVVCALLLGCGLVFGLSALLARGRWDGRLPPLAVLATVLWFWGYVPLVDRVGRRGDLITHAALLPLGVAVTVFLGWWLLRRPAVLDRMTTFLTMVGGILVGWSALSIGRTEWRDYRAIHGSELVRRLAQPIRPRPGAISGPTRDIYLIVLDEYANADATRARYGFDNHVFLDSLRSLGFELPAVHSNYLHTVLSIPSLLNASHLTEITGDVGARTADPTVPNYLVENNRAASFLASRGYRFAFFPSLWWPATRHSPHADWQAGPGGTFDLVRELGRTELRRDLRNASVLDLLHRSAEWHSADADHLRHTFAALARVPSVPGPVFAFAHVLSPHKPFTFDSACRPLAGERTDAAVDGARYVGQIECLNRMLLDLVTRLIRESDVPPVILLQGDHGSAPAAFEEAPNANAIPAAAARERLDAFGAYYLPDRGELLGDSVTIVNVMGDVLRSYAGADLPRERDDMYLSVYATPYAFKRVDAGWLSAGGRGPLVRGVLGARP